MGKLEKIRSLLETNNQIIIANIKEIDRRNNPDILLHTDLAYIVNFNVAPKKSFNIDDLLAQKMQSFMLYIIEDLPNLKPTQINNFEQEIITFKEKEKEKRALFLKMGGFYFDENLYKGIIKTTLHIDDKGYEISRRANYVREITINPFPTENIANNHKHMNYIGCIKLDLKTPFSQ